MTSVSKVIIVTMIIGNLATIVFSAPSRQKRYTHLIDIPYVAKCNFFRCAVLATQLFAMR